LSTCPGSKIGGYPSWGGQDPTIPFTATGQPADYALTISDCEWHNGQPPRWRPLEQVAPPDGVRRKEDFADGSARERIVYTSEEEAELKTWDHARWMRYNADGNPLGTYLKLPMNIFFDRTVTPWKVRLS
jgi:hypothetical protein